MFGRGEGRRGEGGRIGKERQRKRSIGGRDSEEETGNISSLAHCDRAFVRDGKPTYSTTCGIELISAPGALAAAALLAHPTGAALTHVLEPRTALSCLAESLGKSCWMSSR